MQVKIKIITGSFGFEQDKEYEAIIQDGGFFATNGTLSKFISERDAVIA